MTEVRTIPMWHVYGMKVPEGHFLAGCWWTIVIKPERPQEMPPTWRLDWKEDLGMKNAPDKPMWAEAPWLGSFDHEPTEAELEAFKVAVLGPEEAAEYD